MKETECDLPIYLTAALRVYCKAQRPEGSKATEPPRGEKRSAREAKVLIITESLGALPGTRHSRIA